MARYTKASIERLTESVDTVAIVSRRTDLRRVGSRYVGLCPFHEERTPSFSLDAERGLYHCFGCGKGGDTIEFVMETEGLPFPEAVEQLAQDAGVELERDSEDPREEERRRHRERLLALLDRTAGFYANYLWGAAEARRAREYLASRGLSEEVVRAFRVGYAPKAWDRVLMGAQRDGFKPDELLAAGLARRGRGGGIYDWFRERITFPLADSRGRVLGFGGRAMRGDQGAKYVNTPEGELYHKGRLLFGIDRARGAIAKSGRVVVVEGYTDVLALHQAGVADSVAIMGTALTGDQLGQLARAAGDGGTVFLALDADRAGREAMLRAARLAEERNMGLKVVQMPEGSDPAELVTEGGPEAIAARLTEALSVVEFEVERVLADADVDTPEGRDRALVEARDLIAATAERSARRDHLVRRVSDRLDVPAEYVTSGASGTPARPRSEPPGDPGPAEADPPPTNRPAPPRPGTPGAASLEAERIFLALCVSAGPLGREHLSRLVPEHFSSSLTRRARDHLAEHFDDPLAGLPSGDAQLDELVAGIALQADEDPPTGDDSLRISFLALELRRIERDLRGARDAGDFARQGELALAKRQVFDEMSTVMGQAS
ncbi:MAG: DNA primase [Actinomycetota bacterium]|nr:DNA primase [Actinomycetota bacterium]